MSSSAAATDDTGKLIAVIGDEDTVVGFLLAGVGHRNAEGQNFLVVSAETEIPVIEEFFRKVTNRNDVGIVLINQFAANLIRPMIRDYSKVIPTILEIPSKDLPYDASQDSIMQRVNMVLGLQG
jgi:V-type H+-transporting ATPase subunit F